MFNFFKKKAKKEIKELERTDELTKDEIEELENKISILSEQFNNISEEDKNKKAKVLEEIGLMQCDLEYTDAAIETLEKSLEFKLSIGDGYKKLMSLYNKKRAEAAKEGNDEGIDYYMNKMDSMRQIAKKMTLSR